MPLPLLAGSLFTLGFWSSLRIWFFSSVLAITPFLVRNLMVALGIGFVTYAAIDLSLTALLDQVFQRYTAIPSELRNALDSFGVQNALSIHIAGITSALSIKALGGFTRFKLSRPAGVPWSAPTN